MAILKQHAQEHHNQSGHRADSHREKLELLGFHTSSSNPFSRATIVVDFPDRSESANTIILADNLAHMFAASPDPAWVQSASSAAPQNAHFPPRVVTLIHQLRRYNFAAGVDGLLQGSWAQRAVDAIAQSLDTPNSN